MREVVALVSAAGRFSGTVGPFPVESPYWNHVEPVTAHLDRVLGVPTSVLRLISTTGSQSRGGTVTYHVEAHGEPDASALRAVGSLAGGSLAEDDSPLRLPWARPGGPAALVAWADEHVRRTGPAVQVRTWNLSCVYRLPTSDGPVWAKALPPFASDEAAAITMIAAHDAALVPSVLASAPGRVLLADLPSDDAWTPSPELIRDVVPRFVAVQAALAGRPALRKGPVVMPSFGLPDTLLHGDFHPGNWRTGGAVLDWADAHWGHPALDAARLIEYTDDSLRGLIEQVWAAAWRSHCPDSDPPAALRVALPMAHLLNAVKFQEFLDNIEDSERCYHEGDPADELRTAQSLAG